MEYKRRMYGETKSILGIIVDMLRREENAEWHDGVMWVKVSRRYLAKVRLCSERTVTNHINLLLQLGIISKMQLKNNTDKTNYYTLNSVVENGDLREFFSPSMVKKMQNIYKAINKSDIGGNNFQLKIEFNTELKGQDLVGKGNCLTDFSMKTAREEVGTEVLGRIPKNTTAQDMLRIYNETLNRKEIMTMKRARFWVAAWKAKFHRSLEEWRLFLERVKRSAYLMGENFILHINTLLKYSFMDRIFNGEFGVEKCVDPGEEKRGMEEALEHIDSLEEDGICLEARRLILRKTGAKEYLCWMRKVSLERDEEETKPSIRSFYGDYVERNFADELRWAAAKPGKDIMERWNRLVNELQVNMVMNYERKFAR
ncbi:MAG: hypothetical protein LBG20_03830 [Holosporaceae bacterium]|jgi:hypothetical protein|nr:hypothetical protein [Holosporaceae bacterium]